MENQYKGFIFFNRGYDKTIHKHPNAFNLLSIIAQRGKRTNNLDNKELIFGEALIGDYENYGMTRQKYRTATNFLVKHKFITKRTTTRGTIARIIDKGIFDINEDEITTEATNSQPSSNQPVTTNNKVNNDKNENKYIFHKNGSISPNSEESKISSKVAEWLSRPIHGLDFDNDVVLGYTTKLVRQLGADKVNRLYEKYANGAVPNAKSFMATCKILLESSTPSYASFYQKQPKTREVNEEGGE